MLVLANNIKDTRGELGFSEFTYRNLDIYIHTSLLLLVDPYHAWRDRQTRSQKMSGKED